MQAFEYPCNLCAFGEPKQLYSGKLDQLRLGRNNFSFRKYEDSDVRQLASYLKPSRSSNPIPVIAILAVEREGNASSLTEHSFLHRSPTRQQG